MTATSYATPLVGLDAVALDTETTGLDARIARIVQIGALRIDPAALDRTRGFERFINPGVPIPPEVTDVHGITDAMVAEAPAFGAILSELETFLGSSILVGHTIAYDLAVLQREYELAGKVWRPRRALDVRTLAQIAAPTLAHYTLERLCEWLRIEIDGRHTAIGDAEATARVFLALIPLLRQQGVRTLAEAEAATRQLAEREVARAGGLVAESVGPAAEIARPLQRVESFPYRHRVRDVMSAPPVLAPASQTVGATLKQLMAKKVSSVFVEAGPGELGIVTERDVLRALDAHGESGLALPIACIMSKPLLSVSEDAFVYRAIGRLQRLGCRHLGVRDAAGNIVGAVTTRNLLRYRDAAALMLGDEIESAADAAALARAWAKLPLMAKSLIDEDVDPRTIAAVVSSEIRILTRRAAQLAEARLAAAGQGGPPARYAVLVLGSAGRGESLLAADQDNAIVFERGEPDGPEDRWFAGLGAHIADILDEVGVPYCKGGVMARNAQWRHSVPGWHRLVDDWVHRQRPEDLLNVDIFFDAVPVHGDAALGEALWRYAYERGHGAPDFLKLLSEAARERQTPFTLLGGLRLDENRRIDLKRGGLLPIVTGARVLSIKYDAPARATPDRLRAVAAKGIGSAHEIDRVIDAHKTLLGALLNQQLADAERGIPLSSRVDPERLGKSGKRALKAALRSVASVIDLVGEGRF